MQSLSLVLLCGDGSSNRELGYNISTRELSTGQTFSTHQILPIIVERGEGAWRDADGPEGELISVSTQNAPPLDRITLEVEHSSDGLYPTANTGVIRYPGGNTIDVLNIPSWANRIKIELGAFEDSITNAQRVDYTVPGVTELQLKTGSDLTTFSDEVTMGVATQGNQLLIEDFYFTHIYKYQGNDSTKTNYWYTNESRLGGEMKLTDALDRLKFTLTDDKVFNYGFYRITWYRDPVVIDNTPSPPPTPPPPSGDVSGTTGVLSTPNSNTISVHGNTVLG